LTFFLQRVYPAEGWAYFRAWTEQSLPVVGCGRNRDAAIGDLFLRLNQAEPDRVKLVAVRAENQRRPIPEPVEEGRAVA
jgi:hypothetical protein